MTDEVHEIDEFLEPEPVQSFPWRLLLFGLLASGLLSFILQNFEDVTMNFLWFEFTMPEAFVILGTAAVSAILTWSAIAISRKRKKRRNTASSSQG